MPDIESVCPTCGQRHLPRRPTPAASLRVILYSLLVLVVPGTLTLMSVTEPRPMVPLDPQPSPLGYTWSLLFFAVPLVVLLIWFHRHQSSRQERKALWTTFVLLFGLGAVLDIVFGSTFFTFANSGATIGVAVPVIGGTVPIEEFGFYSMGFGAILMTYIWARESWLAAYSPPATMQRVAHAWRALWGFHGGALALTAALIVLAVVLKKFGPLPDHAGFPGYFIFLVITGLLPTILFHRTVQHLVNWEAMNFAVMLLLPISLLWEGVLAAPYQWWGYKPAQMLGISVDAFSGLPLEAVLLWLAVGYAGINVYEVVRLWYRMEESGAAGAAAR